MPGNAKKKEIEQAYRERRAGDLITAADWNTMQIEIRKALNEHNHHGGLDQGGQLDAGAIDPESKLTVEGLKITGELSAKDALLVTAPITITADKDLTVGGNADIKKNLKVTGSYHNGDVLSGSVPAKKPSYEITTKNSKEWEELWSSGEIEIRKDSIIQLTINGSWALEGVSSTAEGVSPPTAFLGAMINEKSIYLGQAKSYGASTISNFTGYVPIGYSALQELEMGKYKFGVGISGNGKGTVKINLAMLNYLIIPK